MVQDFGFGQLHKKMTIKISNKRRSCLISGAMLGLLIIICAILVVTRVGAEVEVFYDAAVQEKHYLVGNGDCFIDWTVYQHESNRGTVSNTVQCRLDLEQRMVLLDKLLAKIMADDAGAEAMQTLQWGSLFDKQAVEHSLRLALAAHQSKIWDSTKGEPVEKSNAEAIQELIEQAEAFKELRQLFAAYGKTLKVASVEKVRVEIAANLPYFAELTEQGAQPQERLPFDALVWFAVVAGE